MALPAPVKDIPVPADGQVIRDVHPALLGVCEVVFLDGFHVRAAVGVRPGGVDGADVVDFCSVVVGRHGFVGFCWGGGVPGGSGDEEHWGDEGEEREEREALEGRHGFGCVL